MTNDLNPFPSAAMDLLLKRRSAKAARMTGKAPEGKDLEQILTAAIRVPDHGKLNPWRFIVAEGKARQTMSSLFEKAWCSEEDESDFSAREKWRDFPLRAPMVITAVSSPKTSTIPSWEQHLSVGAACQNLILASHALGYVANWLTGWAAYSKTISQGMGLSDEEAIAGFIFLGKCDELLAERKRPSLSEVVTFLVP